jgi:hypothetical protein
MADPYSPPSDADLAKYFPLERERMADDVFEIGLVLGGTVSAGAYTAGVLDMLMEWLDCWTRAKEDKDPAAPTHKVVISTVGGTSGGAINGAILLRAAGWSFPRGANSRNPFYDSWTSGVDLLGLLSADKDPGANGFAAVFNCSSLDKQADASIAYKGGPLGEAGTPSKRSYFSDPLRLIMMVGNITGVPYRIAMRGEAGLSHDLVAHADYMRFALKVDGGQKDALPSRPDEFALAPNSDTNWDLLHDTSLATSAFPLAFRSRLLRRKAEMLRWRATLIPGDRPGTEQVRPLIPVWDTLLEGQPASGLLGFVNVDGGTMNNEPIDMVRTAMAGLNGRNPRKGKGAHRTVILVDPFSDPEALGPIAPQSLIGSVMPLLNSWIFQARFKPADIALANADLVFSRFLIAPVGPGYNGQRNIGRKAIAAGGLAGFLGFVDRRFMAYDYALGRHNAYSFLEKHFTFPETNDIFKAGWTENQLKAQTAETDGGVRYIRLIPMLPGVTRPADPQATEWPRMNVFPAALSDAIEERLQAVYDMAVPAAAPDSGWKRWLVSAAARVAWRSYGKPALRDQAVAVLKTGLQKQHLL